MDKYQEKKATGKLVVAEEKAMGRVEAAALMLYVASVGGPIVWTVILGAHLLANVAFVLQSWIAGYWSNQYGTHAPSEVPTFKFLILFVLANVGTSTFNGFSKSSFRWLDITPVGRIITRCTQDMSAIDGQLSVFAGMFLTDSIGIVCLFFSSVLVAGRYDVATVLCDRGFLAESYTPSQQRDRLRWWLDNVGKSPEDIRTQLFVLVLREARL